MRVKQQKSRKNGLPDTKTYFNRVETCCIVAARFDSCIGHATENTPGLYEPAKSEGDRILRLRRTAKTWKIRPVPYVRKVRIPSSHRCISEVRGARTVKFRQGDLESIGIELKNWEDPFFKLQPVPPRSVFLSGLSSMSLWEIFWSKNGPKVANFATLKRKSLKNFPQEPWGVMSALTQAQRQGSPHFRERLYQRHTPQILKILGANMVKKSIFFVKNVSRCKNEFWTRTMAS